jgi:uncharacterized membrane protein
MAGTWTDARLENLLGNVLRFGVALAALLVLCGAVLFLGHHGDERTDYRVFHGEPSDLRHVQGIVTDALDVRGRGLVQFGLLLLIATPITRVVFSAVIFAIQRDWRYVVFTVLVLGVLLFSLTGMPL